MADNEIVTDFQPMTIESPEGMRRRRAEHPQREISTITGEPVPTSKELVEQSRQNVANIVRYVPPIAAGFLVPSLSIPVLAGQALLAGGSEFAARRIERAASDPELDTMWSDLTVGGATGLIDITLGAATRGLGSAFRRIGRKLTIPSEIPLEVRMAQDVLGELPSEQPPTVLRRYMKWLRNKPASRPFSLTYGQLNAEERNFIGWLEGLARAGVGARGVMAKFDVRNERVVTDLIEDYVHARGTQLTGPEFATFAKRIIGEVDERGEMFAPVVAYRKYLYKQFEDALTNVTEPINGTALRRYILESGEIEGGLPRTTYSHLRSEGLVPPLTTPSTTQRRVTTTKVQKVGEEKIDELQDITRTNLLTGKATRKYETTVGERAKAGEGTTQTVRETETVVGLTEEELATEWASIAPFDADKIIKIINRGWKAGMDEHNNVLSYMGRKIEDPFMKLIKRDPALNELHSAADDFFKKEVSFMRNRSIKGLRRALTENPSKVLSMLGGGATAKPAREVYDRLVKLHDALDFSGETLEVLGRTGGKEIAQQEFDRTFLRPLRYHMITRNVDRFGRLEPNRFLDMLNSNADVPEFFNVVFGGPAQVKEVKRLMTALAVLQQPPTEKNIFIQLAQAGALGGALSGATQAILADEPSIKGTGTAAAVGAGTAILLGPLALARVLTDTPTIRMFTDGLEQGIRSGRFAMALRKVAEMAVASTLMRESPTRDAVDFYSTIEAPVDIPEFQVQ